MAQVTTSATPRAKPTVLRVAASADRGPSPPVIYNGHWEFVSRRADGRFAGRSARTYHLGDSMSIFFTGTHVLIYGVTGHNGGFGTLLVPGERARTIDFRSPEKRVHQLMYDSGTLPRGLHIVTMVVTQDPASQRTGYVNIDEVEIRP